MRQEKVPIDMASEQKDILGIISKRHVIYLAVGGLLIYSYAPKVYELFSSLRWIVAAIMTIISAAPVAALVFFLAFKKIEKYNMNLDYYLYIRFQRKFQYGSWRKGHE